MKKKLIIILFFFPLFVISQNQHPPSIKWKQIKTSNFNVVFPENISSEAIRLADMMEYIAEPVSFSLQDKPKRISLFMFNQTAISNGFVSLAPRYSAYYTTPPQKSNLIGGADWMQSLALHEYRHVVQFSRFNKNITRFMSGLFGDYGQAVCMGISIPPWVFEGDAICSETALSAEGRGRLPSFFKGMKALELENIRYSYQKAFLGSYKDYYPNYYHLGYVMSSHIRKNYGDDNWNKIFDRISKFPLTPFRFARSLKIYTGNNLNKTYHNALEEYKNIWEENKRTDEFTQIEIVKSPKTKVWTSYSYTYFTEDKQIIAVKNGLSDSKKIVLLNNNGNENKLVDIRSIDRVHSNGKLVVWSSPTADIRWGQRDYADIIIYNHKTKKKKRITKKKKYFAPAISPFGRQIAVVEYNENMQCSLLILNSNSGKILKKITIESASIIRMPSWSEDEKRICYTTTKGQEKSIAVIELESEKIKTVLPYSPENISCPIFYKNYILYNSPITGVDAIHAIDMNTSEKYIVSSGEYSRMNANVSKDQQEIVLQDYSSNGFKAAIMKLDIKDWKTLSKTSPPENEIVKYLVEAEGKGNLFENYNGKTNSNYKIKKYRALLHTLTRKIHKEIS